MPINKKRVKKCPISFLSRGNFLICGRLFVLGVKKVLLGKGNFSKMYATVSMHEYECSEIRAVKE